MSRPRVVLASGSAIRAQILTAAGVAFTVRKSDVDEAAIKSRLSGANAAGEDIALALAEAKALAVSQDADPQDLIIGADQILRLDNALCDKVSTLGAAQERLRAMRGKLHELLGGLVIARGDEIVFRHQSVSRIQVRNFSDAFLNTYLEAAGEDILASVACYQFEGLGAQMFEAVEGDYYAILGLPLLPLLAALRRLGALEI